MDFLDRLIDYLSNSLPMPTIKVGLYEENGQSVAIRPMPSAINERYIEKSKVYPYAFQVLVHNKSNAAARMTAQQFFDELDFMDKTKIESGNESFELLAVRCTTTPNFVQKTSYGHLWTVSFEAELYLRGDGQ